MKQLRTMAKPAQPQMLADALADALTRADAVIIGAGAGLSTSAGFTYSGERFETYFGDFARKYGFRDMYTGGFTAFPTPEEHWAYWSRYIWINRYQNAPKPVYNKLFSLIRDKDYFVLTTNVDHCFQKAGFDKHRLFYTQGDYGLFQCSRPCCQKTYDNEEIIENMVLSQGFQIATDRSLQFPADAATGRSLLPPASAAPAMSIPGELVPRCPVCGRPMTMNLRVDDTFAQDEGWYQAADRYQQFLRRHEHMRLLFLELGVGYNTAGIIKYPFWQMTYENPKAVYACVNQREAAAPGEIADRSICIDGDIGETLEFL